MTEEQLERICAAIREVGAAILAAMNAPSVTPSPVPESVENCARVGDLELSVRSYNCLHNTWGTGINFDVAAPATAILMYPRARAIRNFGKVSFYEVLNALVDAGVSIEQIEMSPFYCNTPSEWRKRWKTRSAR